MPQLVEFVAMLFGVRPKTLRTSARQPPRTVLLIIKLLFKQQHISSCFAQFGNQARHQTGIFSHGAFRLQL